MGERHQLPKINIPTADAKINEEAPERHGLIASTRARRRGV